MASAAPRRRSVVPVFPPEGSNVVRAGSLPGEPGPKVDNSDVRGRGRLVGWVQLGAAAACGWPAATACRLAAAPARCPPPHSPGPSLGSNPGRSACPALSPAAKPPQTSSFIAQFDLDGDDRLSFDEFLLFQTLLAIPVQDIEVAFRVIDRGAWRRALGLLRGRPGGQNGAGHRGGLQGCVG